MRLSVTDDSSHKVLFTMRMGRGGFIAVPIILLLVIMGGTYLLVSRTSLRQTIPGYPDIATRSAAMESVLKADSLANAIDQWSFMVNNIQRVMTGDTPLPLDSLAAASGTAQDEDALTYGAIFARNDSLLREEIRRQEQFDLSLSDSGIRQIESIHFFSPVHGVVSRQFGSSPLLHGIEVAVEPETMVYAALDGTVISAGWSDSDAYSIAIQHDNDLISIYRNNGKLFKETGDKVKAGTMIALSGTDGSGSHLILELWHKGEAIDPALYILF